MKKTNLFLLAGLTLVTCVACSGKDDEGGTAVTTKPASMDVKMSGEANAPQADQGANVNAAPPPPGP
jgi:hypothetical protein